MRKITITAALASVALAASASTAAAQEEVHTATVEFADLDINSVSGAEMLDRRIDAAVREVCRPPRQKLTVSQHTETSACRAAARADADDQLENLRRGTVQILAVRAHRAEQRNQ